MNSVKEENPALWEQIWVFNSFFYKKLSVKKWEFSVSFLSLHHILTLRHSFEEGYRSVKKWTSKAKIFEKEYIIIPINEQWAFSFLSWMLSIDAPV